MSSESEINLIKEAAYWDDFYGRRSAPTDRSSFAQWVFDNFLNEGDTLFEFGCGNGRDSGWFASNKLKVWALDQSVEATGALAYKGKAVDNINILNQSINLFIENNSFPKEVAFVYSRFFLHSITKLDCERLFEFIGKNCRSGTVCMHEFRVTEDMENFDGDLISRDELVTDHYRRFIDFSEMLSFIAGKGWKILFSEKGKGLAVYGDQDPMVGRVVFRIE